MLHNDKFQRKTYIEASRDILLLPSNQAQVPMLDMYNHLVLHLDRIQMKRHMYKEFHG
jgi:hypothetical protein